MTAATAATITVHDYKTGNELRAATEDDLSRALRAEGDEGVYEDADGVAVFLQGIGHDHNGYDTFAIQDATGKSVDVDAYGNAHLV